MFVGPPGGDGLGQVLDAELIGTEPVGGVWASDHFGVLAVLRGRSSCGEQDSVSRGGPTSETGN